MPASPNKLVPYITVGWIVLGALYLTVIERRRPDVFAAMGRVWGDEETAVAVNPATATAAGGGQPSECGVRALRPRLRPVPAEGGTGRLGVAGARSAAKRRPV